MSRPISKNLDEKLVQYAYGELSASESKKLEALIASRADLQARVKLLSSSRLKLNLLQEIPEPQLSTERLRDAILGQGLRPEARPEPAFRISNVFAWTLTAVAVGVIGGTYFLYPRNARTGNIATHSQGAANKSSSGTLLAAQDRAPEIHSAVSMSLAGRSNAKAGTASEVDSRRGERGGNSRTHFARQGGNSLAGIESSVDLSKVDLDEAKQVLNELYGRPGQPYGFPEAQTTDESAGAVSGGFAPLGHAGLGSANLPSASAGSHGTSAKSKTTTSPRQRRTLVVIDGDQDPATGLPKANEVADESHVVLSS
jgi:hypothetical protein